MKTLLLAGAFALIALPAFAAGVTVTLSVGPTVYTTTITAPNAARLATWAAGAYPTIPNPAYDPNKPVDPVTNPQTIANPTPGVSALAAVWQGIIANIQNSELTTAKAAVAAPAPVN